MIASLVRRGGRVADIGTDHAYVPVYLTQNGICPCAVAADVGEGPLENAARTVERYGLGDKITLILSDGLDSVPEGCADDIIIAGMGGTLMTQIISRCEWLKSEGVRLILQPMTHHEDVRKWLVESGFCIIKEAACFCDSRAYAAIAAEYDGKRRAVLSPYYFIGELPESEYNPQAAGAFLKRQLARISERFNALTSCGQYTHEREMLGEAARAIEKILEEGGFDNDNRS